MLDRRAARHHGDLGHHPAADHAFAGYGGACAGTATRCEVVMKATATVSASFADRAAPEDCLGQDPAQLTVRQAGPTQFQPCRWSR